jgi:hypothetical protein
VTIGAAGLGFEAVVDGTRHGLNEDRHGRNLTRL